MSSKLLFAFLAGLLAGAAAVGIALYLLQGAYVEASNGRGPQHCLGRARTGMMTAEENTAFLSIDSACERLDAGPFNDALVYPPEAVELTCAPAKPRFVEPEVPLLGLSVTNRSAKPIFVLEPHWERNPDASKVQLQGVQFDWQDALNSRARYIWRLAPGEARTLTFSPTLEDYGEHHVMIAFGPWKITGLSKASSSAKEGLKNWS
jgi:hypothetical protein